MVVVHDATGSVNARKRAEALGEIGSELAAAGSLGEVLASILTSVRGLAAGMDVLVLLADPDGDRLRGTVRLSGAEDVEVAVPLRELPAAARATELGRTVEVPLQEGTGSLESAWVGAAGRHVVCTPLRAGERSEGVLYITCPAGQVRPSVPLFDALASICALAVRRARLLDREHQAVLASQAATERLQILTESGAMLSHALDWSAVIRAIAQLPLGYLADLSVLLLADDEGTLRREAVEEIPAAVPPLPSWLVADRGVPETPGVLRAFETGIPRRKVLPATIERPDPRDIDATLLHDLGGVSALAAPLMLGRRVLGVLLLVRRGRARPHEHEDLLLATELGRRAALAVDNARLLARVQEEVHRRDEFVAIAAHELRTPLAAIELQAGAIRRRANLDSEARARINRLERSLRRMGRLLDQLLDATRVSSAHGIALRPEQVDLAAVVREVLAELGDLVRVSGCEVRVHATGPVEGRFDRAALESVVSNLLTNAVKFCDGKPIDVTVEVTDATARLEVRDRGIGIAPGFQPHVFERYARDAPSRHYGGLGVGLWITRRFVEAHGGTIRVDSVPEQGTRFEVQLPREPPASPPAPGNA